VSKKLFDLWQWTWQWPIMAKQKIKMDSNEIHVDECVKMANQGLPGCKNNERV